MELEYSDDSLKDLQKFEKQLQAFFIRHVEKLQKMPPRRHMRHGLPWHVENVTQQARLLYKEKEGVLQIVRCFATHKEYERWYNSMR